jgi:hypothetical protein
MARGDDSPAKPHFKYALPRSSTTAGFSGVAPYRKEFIFFSRGEDLNLNITFHKQNRSSWRVKPKMKV